MCLHKVRISWPNKRDLNARGDKYRKVVTDNLNLLWPTSFRFFLSIFAKPLVFSIIYFFSINYVSCIFPLFPSLSMHHLIYSIIETVNIIPLMYVAESPLPYNDKSVRDFSG